MPLTDSPPRSADLDLGAGSHRASVTLEPADSLPQDDQFFSIIEHREPHALIIGATAGGDDVVYFAAAVGAPHQSSPRRRAHGRRMRSADARSPITPRSWCRTLACSTARAPGSIQRYLEGGGTVLMTLGPRARASIAFRSSGHQRADRNLNSQGGGWTGRVSAVEQSHPALREAQGWRSVRFFRYVAVEPQEGDAALDPLRRWAALLIERHVGRGDC